MAQVDFYQLSRDPVDRVAVLLARKLFDAGQRLLIVADNDALLNTISEALWADTPSSFLAHERAGTANDAVQPILLSSELTNASGARHIMIADGTWRDKVITAERVFYLFTPDRIDEARAAWRALKDADGLIRNFWRQDNGRWIKAA